MYHNASLRHEKLHLLTIVANLQLIIEKIHLLQKEKHTIVWWPRLRPSPTDGELSSSAPPSVELMEELQPLVTLPLPPVTVPLGGIVT